MAIGKKTGGRRKGTPNKATADIKAAAAVHGPAALGALAEIATDASAPAAARVSAAVALLDRGFGKPTQAVELGGAGGGPIQQQHTHMTSKEFRQIAQEVAGKF